MVQIEILHDSVKVLGWNRAVEGLENGIELGNGDLAIVVTVESIKDFLALVGANQSRVVQAMRRE